MGAVGPVGKILSIKDCDSFVELLKNDKDQRLVTSKQGVKILKLQIGS